MKPIRRLTTRGAQETGTALLEAAITVPILLLLTVGIFEFGRAYQTWQVLTNAAREGARMSVLPNQADGSVEARVLDYMESGQLQNAGTAEVTVDRNAELQVGGGTVSASRVTVSYPFDFIVLQPVARLVAPDSSTGDSLVLVASALMRNEAQ